MADAPLHTMPLDQLHFDEGAVLAVNKPLQWTSFDVVKKLRVALQVKKIGHAGTLDPLATGLLLICTGKKTKEISCYQALEKGYSGELVIGKTTPSIDLETPFNSESDYTHITEAMIYQVAKTFTGYIAQVPPLYAAIKINGQRAYQRARQGKTTLLASRQVFIRSFVITAVSIPRIHFEVTCSKGTYIRSLVSDFGQLLGVGAYLNALCRTHIGPYRLETAYELADLIHISSSQHKEPGITPSKGYGSLGVP